MAGLKRPHQKPTRKIGVHCISRMHVDEMVNGKYMVKFISSHTGHDIGHSELPYIPLRSSTKDKIALKLSKGVACERIVEGICKVNLNA